MVRVVGMLWALGPHEPSQHVSHADIEGRHCPHWRMGNRRLRRLTFHLPALLALLALFSSAVLEPDLHL